MATLIRKLNLKVTLGLLLLAGVFAGLLSGVLVRAAGPEFNKFPITYTKPGAPSFLDYPLLDARRVGGVYSSSQADHDDGITVDPGDEIDVTVYYHNGVVDDSANTAVNTVVKAFLSPALNGTANSHILSATIGANNAETVSSADESRGGNIEIKITGNEPRSLSLVSGTVKQLKNWGSREPANGSSNISQTVSLPNSIFTSGVGLGDIRGCWPFFGFVSFRLKVSADQINQGLEITKQVLNVTKDETDYHSSTNAVENDIVRFRVEIKTTGNASQTQTVVRDTLPSRLSFVTGDDLRGDGVTIGTIAQNQTRTFTFDTKVTGSSSGTVTNTAKVKSSVVSEKTASADVIITKPADLTRGLEITKRVRNVTDGTSFSSSTNAREGDTVRFEIVVRTTGNGSQTHVTVRDNLPSRLQFISGSGDDIRDSGTDLGSLSENTTKTFTFDVRVTGGSAATVTNTARVRSNEVSEKSASANVAIAPSDSGSVSRGLSITKRVRNITDNTSLAGAVDADPGDIVQFEIRIDTSGDASQHDVWLRDILPSKLAFRSGDSIATGSGRNLGTLSAGTSRTFVYDAAVAGSSEFTGSTTSLANNASVRSNEVSERFASAIVRVNRSTVSTFEKRKTAFNITRQVSATLVSAQPGDIIAYTLYFRNIGSGTIVGHVFEDYIADVLELAEIADQGGALSVDHTIRWAPVDVSAGTEVSRTFQVRVRAGTLFPVSSDLVMTNVYGNEVRVPVIRGSIAGVTTPPRTGASENLGFLLASMSTIGYWIVRKRKIFTLRARF